MAMNRLTLSDVQTFVEEGELFLRAIEGKGESARVLDSEPVNPLEWPVEIQRRLLWKGLGATIEGRSSEVKGARQKLDYLRERELRLWPQGQWAAKREGGGGGPVPLWIRAVARVKGISETQAAQAMEHYSEEQREAIKANPQVQEAREAIKAEARESKPEAGALDDLLG